MLCVCVCVCACRCACFSFVSVSVQILMLAMHVAACRIICGCSYVCVCLCVCSGAGQPRQVIILSILNFEYNHLLDRFIHQVLISNTWWRKPLVSLVLCFYVQLMLGCRVYVINEMRVLVVHTQCVYISLFIYRLIFSYYLNWLSTDLFSLSY